MALSSDASEALLWGSSFALVCVVFELAFVTHSSQGYKTAKGTMIRQILFPKNLSSFTFYRDAVIFMLLLLAAAVAGMIWTAWRFIADGNVGSLFMFSSCLNFKRKVTAGMVIVRVLDIVTVCF